MLRAETPFILFECLYLFLVLGYIFSRSRIILGLAYGLAGLKYSLSALNTSDIKNYEIVHRIVDRISLEPVNQQEGSFASLLYIGKLLNISVAGVHFLSIIAFLASVAFLFHSFLPKSKAITISLLLGFVPVGGELCLYLLRQLLSTSFVFVGMGFLFRNRPLKALLIGFAGILFHSTAVIYLPLFISGFARGKILKMSIILGSYGFIFWLFSNLELGSDLVINAIGAESLYTAKYEFYTSFSGEKGWRDGGSIGLLTIIMVAYFIAINVWNRLYFLRSPIWLFYFFTFIIVAFQFSLEILKVFWISSRFTFIADLLLLTSNILISIEILPRKYYHILIFSIVVALFWISVYLITAGHVNDNLYDLHI
jgi:hypothetical protein